MNAEYKNLLSGAYERITIVDVATGEKIAEITDDRIYTSECRIMVELKPKAEKRQGMEMNAGEAEVIAGFIQFWRAYPKHKAKVTAQKAWKKLHPDQKLKERILADIEEKKGSKEWNEQDGQFVPYPASYLNQKRWEDEADLKEQKHGYQEHEIEDLDHLLLDLDA